MMVIPTSTMDRLTHTIQMLQQIQRRLPISATLSDVADLLVCIEAEYGPEILLEDVIQPLSPIAATLSDVVDLLACVKATYGSEIQLEKVIQTLVGEHLAEQVQQRVAIRRRFQIEQKKVAA